MTNSKKMGWPVLIGLALAVSLLCASCGEATATTAGRPFSTSGVAASTVAATVGPVSRSTQAPAASVPTVAALAPTPIPPVTSGQARLATSTATISRTNGPPLVMTVELARTAQEQGTGLMGRTSLPDNTGMLFVFEQVGRVGFWMKDTPLALSIAFIDASGKIVDIQDMESFSETTHIPNTDYLYALEVSKGYFARVGVRPGDLFKFGN